jgi:hypothetical protein
MQVYISQITSPFQVSTLKFNILFIVYAHLRKKTVAKFLCLNRLLPYDQEKEEMSLPEPAMSSR